MVLSGDFEEGLYTCAVSDIWEVVWGWRWSLEPPARQAYEGVLTELPGLVFSVQECLLGGGQGKGL